MFFWHEPQCILFWTQQFPAPSITTVMCFVAYKQNLETKTTLLQLSEHICLLSASPHPPSQMLAAAEALWDVACIFRPPISALCVAHLTTTTTGLWQPGSCMAGWVAGCSFTHAHLPCWLSIYFRLVLGEKYGNNCDRMFEGTGHFRLAFKNKIIHVCIIKIQTLLLGWGTLLLSTCRMYKRFHWFDVFKYHGVQCLPSVDLAVFFSL